MPLSTLVTSTLKRPGVQVALITLAYLALGYKAGVFIFVFVLPFYAALVTLPFIELLRGWRHGMRRAVWQEAQGQYYAFRDVRVHVLEDESHCRWVRTADIRRIYAPLVSERQLRTQYPHTSQFIGKPAQLYLRDDVLVKHLRQVNEALALRLGTWVERSIFFPGSKLRQRYGIRLDDE
jgi:hypothetical protein